MTPRAARPRVVSLVPSATETLSAWGVEPVAVTRFCERPDLPSVGGTKDPDIDAVVAAAPDLVVLCREENRREDADALAAAGLALEVLDIDALDDVAVELSRLARRLGLEPADLPLGAVEAPPAADAAGPGRVAFVPVWRRPWITISGACYAASLLRRLGIDPVVTAAGGRYPRIEPERLVGRVDLVLAPSEPYPFSERHHEELSSIAPVTFVDGQDLFWWGVRTPAALARLRAQLTPPQPSV